jgi:hypothetical protein
MIDECFVFAKPVLQSLILSTYARIPLKTATFASTGEQITICSLLDLNFTILLDGKRYIAADINLHIASITCNFFIMAMAFAL